MTSNLACIYLHRANIWHISIMFENRRTGPTCSKFVCKTFSFFATWIKSSHCVRQLLPVHFSITAFPPYFVRFLIKSAALPFNRWPHVRIGWTDAKWLERCRARRRSAVYTIKSGLLTPFTHTLQLPVCSPKLRQISTAAFKAV